jgi:hypothetical protein
MSEKIDEYIDKAVNVKKEDKLNEVLDSIIEKLISERLPPSKNDEESKKEQVLAEALDSYSLSLTEDHTIKMLSEKRTQSLSKAARAKNIVLSLPKMNITEEWGDPNSQTRVEIKRFADNIGGKTIQSKFDSFMKIQKPSNKITSQTRIISSLILLESLRSLIKTANAASAGFAFEGFIAALMNGRQVSDPVDGSLPIEDVMLFTYEDSNSSVKSSGATPASLKLLQQGGSVKGSYTNMIDALYGEKAFENGVPYIVAFKTPNAPPGALQEADSSASKTEDLSLVIYEFIFSPENVFRVLKQAGAKASNEISMQLDPSRLRILKKGLDLNAKASIDFISGPRRGGVYKRWQKLLDNPPIGDPVFRQMLACTRGYSVDKFKALLSGLGPAPSPTPQTKETIQEATTGDGGHQWLLNSSFFAESHGNAKMLGKLDISSAAIYQTAEYYADILQDGIAVLFEATSALSENINTYFVAKDRNTGLNAGRNAIVHTKKIQKNLNKTMKS